jgi:hypothetical protein
MKQPNYELKGELIRLFGTQGRAAAALGTNPFRLSHVIQGHAPLNQQEQQTFARAIGDAILRRLLAKAPSK